MGRIKANRTIQGSLSVEGINSIISQLQQYKTDLQRRQERFVRRLAEEGFDIAAIQLNDVEEMDWNERHYTSLDTDKQPGTLTIETQFEGEIASCTLTFSGQQVLFIEFGAGFFWNPLPNPKESEFGYGVGTFPGQKHANDENGWAYYGEDNQWHRSMGIKATMPMYHASVQIREKVVEIAKEVFGSVN